MIKRGRELGFTLVELVVVIVVIGILAGLTVVGYNGVQARARDTKIRDAADKVADAVQLFVSAQGHFPLGGYGSTTAPTAGTECTDGANGWFASGLYLCSVEDSLVNLGYLPAGYSGSIPDNKNYSTGSKRAIMVYKYSNNYALVYYSLEQATSADTDHFNKEMTECGLNPAGAITQRDSYGMRDGICFKY